MPTPPGIVVAEKITEELGGRSYELNERGDGSFRRMFTLRFRLEDIATADAATKMEASVAYNLPVAQGDGHPSDAAATARTIRIANAGSLEEWTCEVLYSSAPFEARGDGANISGSPPTPANVDNQVPADLRLPEIRISKKDVSKVLETDAQTFADVVNSAGDPFDPPLITRRAHQVFHLTFWRTPAQLNTNDRMKMVAKVNDAAYTILGITYQASELLVDDIAIEGVWDRSQADNLAFFWKITVVLEVQLGGWGRRVLQAGKREKLASGEKRVIRDDTGQPVSDPVPLAASGAKLAAGASFVYTTVNEFATCSFTQLFA